MLVVPIVWWSALPIRARLLGAGVAILVTALVIAPWIVRNQRSVGEATISTSSPATSLAGANCDATYGGPSIGSWEFSCTSPETRAQMSEAQWDAQLRSQALGYARDHARRLPLVLPARELRVWGLWSPADLVARDAEETRTSGFQWIVWATGLVTLVGGAVGLVALRDQGRRTIVLAGPIAMVAITALVSHGNPRFRSVAEPMFAIGLAALAVRVARRRAGSHRTLDNEIDVRTPSGDRDASTGPSRAGAH
jgi:hypothetical protein